METGLRVPLTWRGGRFEGGYGMVLKRGGGLAGPFFAGRAGWGGGQALPWGFWGGEIGAQAMVLSTLLGASAWRETLAGVGSDSFFFFLNKVESE